jgi:two-component system cell cycle sensor histidine kinase/response regulator CckA
LISRIDISDHNLGARAIEPTKNTLPDSKNPAVTILIVDDEEFLLEYVRLVLVRAGYSALTAQDGDEAWDLIVDQGGEIRLLLTDIVMPGSLDGFELADLVRRHQPDLPVLFMTGTPLQDHPHADLLTRESKLLRKPFFPDQLLTIVRENLEAAGQTLSRRL